MPIDMPDEDHEAHREARRGAGAAGDEQRHHAEHHGGGGHQDRAQTDARRSTIASRLLTPCFSFCWLANSTIRMPCLVISPTRVIRPTCGVDVERRQTEIQRKIMAPNIESGTDIMMMNGSRKLSNCAASTR